MADFSTIALVEDLPKTGEIRVVWPEGNSFTFLGAEGIRNHIRRNGDSPEAGPLFLLLSKLEQAAGDVETVKKDVEGTKVTVDWTARDPVKVEPKPATSIEEAPGGIDGV